MVKKKIRKAAKKAPTFEDHPEFTPFTTPARMCKLGIFRGTYFAGQDLIHISKRYRIPVKHLTRDSLFDVDCGLSKAEWIKKGWIFDADPLGWFQWYMRFYRGRREPEMDAIQIARWKAYRDRNIGADGKGGMLAYQGQGDPKKGLKTRQSLLHWAINPLSDII